MHERGHQQTEDVMALAPVAAYIFVSCKVFDDLTVQANALQAGSIGHDQFLHDLSAARNCIDEAWMCYQSACPELPDHLRHAHDRAEAIHELLHQRLDLTELDLSGEPG